MFSHWELLSIVVVFFIKFIIPVVLIILIVKYILRSNEERRRLRLEVGKLADELEQIRKKHDNKENDSSD